MTTAFPDNVPMLSDGVVRLRALTSDDLPRVVEQCQDLDSLRYTTVPRPYSDEHAKAFLTKVATDWDRQDQGATTLNWAVEEISSPGTYYGSIELRTTGHATCEVGFLLHPHGRGRSLMSRAVRLAQAEAVRRGVTTIIWRAVAGNLASWRVAWSCGFTAPITHPALIPQADPAGIYHDIDEWMSSWRAGDPTTPRMTWYDVPTLEIDLTDLGGTYLGDLATSPPSGSGPAWTCTAVRLRRWQDTDGAAMPSRPHPLDQPLDAGQLPGQREWPTWYHARLLGSATGTEISWAIVADLGMPGTEQLIGTMALTGIDRYGDAELRAELIPAARNHGLFSQLLPTVLDHAFAPVEDGGAGLTKIHATPRVDDLAAGMSLARTGMTYVGLSRTPPSTADPGDHGRALWEILREDDQHSRERHATRVACPPPRLCTPTVLLRALTDTDADAVAALLRQPSAGPHSHLSVNSDDAQRWIAHGVGGIHRGSTMRWAICPQQDDGTAESPVGFIRAFALNDSFLQDSAEIGYLLHPDHRGQGLASAAVHAVTSYLLAAPEDGGLGRHRVTARALAENVASHRVLERAGYRRWTVEPAAVPIEQGRADVWHYVCSVED
ncbi:hypothetical protein KEM60_03021 [Austwickia sp. TVS 96-490-7B]|uniref:GNAT family N-acetyltransferase n=1 Tax=Austwickia sp. TVS 96-490-7B TaxID=2830843 RepID=UPI001C56F179|nr:GNAT family N-acetyltransferase [Austwickia sp. TVS 96-490-7B]MBW3086792.1 hypothetical protein [Austwickia sp. TVS 96-490-7B]